MDQEKAENDFPSIALKCQKKLLVKSPNKAFKKYWFFPAQTKPWLDMEEGESSSDTGTLYSNLASNSVGS